MQQFWGEAKMLNFGRYFLALVMSLGVSIQPSQSSDVDFDTRLTVACRDVSPDKFRTANPNQRVMEATLRISANFPKITDQVKQIEYRLYLPDNVELADHLPRTQLGSEFAAPIAKTSKGGANSQTMKSVYVSFEGEANLRYRLPYDLVSGGVGLSGANNTESSTSTGRHKESSIELAFLPPKQVVIASGTKRRGSVLYYKLRPYSQVTLEGEKEFALLLVVPASWDHGQIELECWTVLGSSSEHLQKSVLIGIYDSKSVDGKDAARELAATVKENVPPDVSTEILSTPKLDMQLDAEVKSVELAGVYFIPGERGAGFVGRSRRYASSMGMTVVALHPNGQFFAGDAGVGKLLGRMSMIPEASKYQGKWRIGEQNKLQIETKSARDEVLLDSVISVDGSGSLYFKDGTIWEKTAALSADFNFVTGN
ncbi:MAG: hypothetical protein ABJZ55_15240 [Fuerstiella sp.]